MKRLVYLSVVLLALLIPMSACGQIVYLGNIKNNPNIEFTYINKTLLKLAKTVPHSVRGWYLGPNDNLENVEIATSENKEGAQLLKNEAQKIVEKNHLELLMQRDDPQEKEFNWIYGKLNKDGDRFTVLMIVNIEEDEGRIVIVTGNLSLENFRIMI